MTCFLAGTVYFVNYLKTHHEMAVFSNFMTLDGGATISDGIVEDGDVDDGSG
jgi:hypothetical protein